MKKRSSQTQVKSILLVLVFFTVSFGLKGQEGAYWQGLQTKNPAAIGTPSDWIFGNYHFSNLGKLLQEENQYLTGFFAGADYNITPDIGSVGIIYASEKMGNENVIQTEFSYARPFSLNKGALNIGILAGLQNHKTKISMYSSYNPYENNGGYSYDGYGYGYGSGYGYGYGYGYEGYYPHYNYDYNSEDDDYFEDIVNKFVKTGVGLFYNSDKVDLGISAVRYFDLNRISENEQYYDIEYDLDYITILGAYRFRVNEKLVIEPNLMIDFFKERRDIYAGIFCEFKKQFHAGYSVLKFDDLHSLMLGADLAKNFRLGYSYNFTDLFDSSGINLHEFTLGYRLQ